MLNKHTPSFIAVQNGVWRKGWLSPSAHTATSQLEGGFWGHRSAIAAVERCQFDVLFEALLASVTVVVG